jgi:hypothetical protein
LLRRKCPIAREVAHSRLLLASFTDNTFFSLGNPTLRADFKAVLLAWIAAKPLHYFVAASGFAFINSFAILLASS